MIKMKKLQYIALPFVCSALFSSCSEDIMDRINKDHNNMQDAPAKSIVTDVLTSTAFSMVGGDFSTYLSTYIEHEVGCHNQLFRAENRNVEPSSSSTFNNAWRSGYKTLQNSLLVVEKCSDNGSEPGNDVTRGIGELMTAYNLALLTDLFGDIPWSESCNMSQYFTPKIDKQEDIYKDIFKYIDNAIISFEGEDSFQSVGYQDLIYTGSNTKWKKAAHGIKARYLLRSLPLTADNKDILEEVVANVNKSFTSASEQLSYNSYSGANLNPLMAFFWSRAAIAASKSMFEKLEERNDPRTYACFIDSHYRRAKVITPSTINDIVPIAVNGMVTQGQYSNAGSIFVAAQSADTHILSYHEILFIKAEALTRLGRVDEAKEVLKTAVVAAIENTAKSIDAAYKSSYYLRYGGIRVPDDVSILNTKVAEEYFDNEVAPLFDANPLKEVMTQKYIGMFGANGEAVETYSDIRRMMAMGEDFIELKNPNNANNKFPLRLPYGNSDTTTNPNVNAAYGNGQYVYTEPVWWAGGTR